MKPPEIIKLLQELPQDKEMYYYDPDAEEYFLFDICPTVNAITFLNGEKKEVMILRCKK